MKNWKLPGFVVLTMVVCVIVFVPVSADTLPETASDQAATAFPATVSLSPPLFLTQGDTGPEGGCSPAFNVSQAGISSYVKLSQPIDLGKAVAAFDQIKEWDDTHALGEVWIKNRDQTFKPLVYVDTAGNIVAYYPNDTPSSNLVSWEGVSFTAPSITDFTTNLAISKVCTQIGVSYNSVKNTIRYYHFGYPNAGKMLVFLNAGTSGSKTSHIHVPGTYTQYEASGSLTNGELYVDDVLRQSVHGYILTFNYGSHLAKGLPHSIRYVHWYFGGGIGNVILYSEG